MYIVADPQKLLVGKAISRSVASLGISAACENLRLVKGNKILYSVSEVFCDYCCVQLKAVVNIIA